MLRGAFIRGLVVRVGALVLGVLVVGVSWALPVSRDGLYHWSMSCTGYLNAQGNGCYDFSTYVDTAAAVFVSGVGCANRWYGGGGGFYVYATGEGASGRGFTFCEWGKACPTNKMVCTVTGTEQPGGFALTDPSIAAVAAAVVAAMPAGATTAEIAAAVVAAMPAGATTAEIAAAVVAALPAGVSSADVAAAVLAALPAGVSSAEVAAAVVAALGGPPGGASAEAIAAAVIGALDMSTGPFDVNFAAGMFAASFVLIMVGWLFSHFLSDILGFIRRF